MSKRGLSGVVETVLIVMLTVGAIAIIATFLIPFVKDSLSKSTECVGMEEVYKFEQAFDLNCVNVSFGKKNAVFSVKANNVDEEKVAGFDVVVYGQGESKVISVRKVGSSDELKMYPYSDIITRPRSGESVSYSYPLSAGKDYNYMELRTALANGRVCETANDKINLFVC